MLPISKVCWMQKHTKLVWNNKKDIDEIKQDYLKGLIFHYVKDIKDVLKIALEK